MTEKQPNRTHAVMSQRHEDAESPDDFPTPPWATRALMEFLASRNIPLQMMSVWEPAAGRGDMLGVLKQTFGRWEGTDLYPYPIKDSWVRHGVDFIGPSGLEFGRGMWGNGPDWVITNPPFNVAKAFADTALAFARTGVALLCRLQFLEGGDRSGRAQLFREKPPAYVLQFCERVPMFKARLDPKGSTATAYAWFVWLHYPSGLPTTVHWVPPGTRKRLEREGGYA